MALTVLKDIRRIYAGLNADEIRGAAYHDFKVGLMAASEEGYAELERFLAPVWLGERAVGLMWRDDLDTAFRHLDLYDRFGCPGEHIQISFRCVVRQGNIDPKATETFNARVHSCWINPALPPAPAANAAADKTEKSGTK